MIVPKIDVFAAGTYNPANSFTYTYQDYPYWFSPESTLDMPENIGIYSDVLDYVIEIGASAQVLQFSSYYPFGFVLGLSENFANYIFSLVINARIALGKAFSWILPSNVNCVYAWQIKFLGVQDSYLDYDPNLYGPAYGWRFEGLLGEDIDVVLDQYGDFYGDNVVPHGNYTFTDQSDEVEWISSHQTSPNDDEIYLPSTHAESFNDMPKPYISGKDLHFFCSSDGVNFTEYIFHDFRETAINIDRTTNHLYALIFYNTHFDTSYLSDVNGNVISFFGSGNGVDFYRNNIRYRSGYRSYRLSLEYINLPCPLNWQWDYYYDTANLKGCFNDQLVYGSSPCLWLKSISYTPNTDPVEIPVDVPVPFDDIPEDPTDYEPDPLPTPDPVPGSDYPEPEPQPTPVPPVPPIVSGNDDLWPDMNEIFNTEAEMDSFLTPLSNFEFTSLANLTDEFSASIVWVSTIMMSLYNGSEYSVLFSILAIFFIACALLGIYKWWSS